jgi:hypothetical protein
LLHLRVFEKISIRGMQNSRDVNRIQLKSSRRRKPKLRCNVIRLQVMPCIRHLLVKYLSAYKKADLQALAMALGLPNEGKNLELSSRIQAHLDTNQDLQENPRFSGLFIHGSQRKMCVDRGANHSAGNHKQQNILTNGITVIHDNHTTQFPPYQVNLILSSSYHVQGPYFGYYTQPHDFRTSQNIYYNTNFGDHKAGPSTSSS